MDKFISRQMMHISALSETECNLFNIVGKDFKEKQSYCSTVCKCGCDYSKTHLYGCFEAQRWDGKYCYYCPKGYIFISVVLVNELDKAEYGVITGPILMGEAEDFEEEDPIIPCINTKKVNSLTEIMSTVFSKRIESGLSERGSFLNGMYLLLENEEELNRYPIELERELQQAVVNGDAENARELINKLLGIIFFHSNGDLKIIKSRVRELIVLLSRSAIEGGADVNQIFVLNGNYIETVEELKSIEEVSVWLSGVINRFVSYVFDFKNIKHINVIYKASAYIKENYMNKICLNDIAEHTYMSKAYLSKIFKEEMNCSITSYINNIRISKSKLFLKDFSLSLADVSNLAGFEDQSYFTKIFKSITGFSPGKYRERIRTE